MFNSRILGFGSIGCAELERIVDEYSLQPGGYDVLLARIDALRGIEDCIRDGMELARSSRDWRRFDRYVLAALSHPSPVQTSVLCEVLALQTEEVNSEDKLARSPVSDRMVGTSPTTARVVVGTRECSVRRDRGGKCAATISWTVRSSGTTATGSCCVPAKD